jgi:hypothetical protein
VNAVRAGLVFPARSAGECPAVFLPAGVDRAERLSSHWSNKGSSRDPEWEWEGPDGTTHEMSGDRIIRILTTLGRDGWEVVAVTSGQYEWGGSISYLLKRPTNEIPQFSRGHYA